jgi:hypothetical protein
MNYGVIPFILDIQLQKEKRCRYCIGTPIKNPVGKDGIT